LQDKRTNILIVEDDVPLCRGIELTLKEAGRVFTLCRALSDARRVLRDTLFDLLILDVNLPDGSGLEFCREIRADFHAPILFLTANDTELDMVEGLETGGDDYVTKPFSLAVLRARVNALLRREVRVSPRIYVSGSLRFDFENMQFLKNNDAVELSKTEQRLLLLLLNNRGRTCSRDWLLDRIWPGGGAYVDENALSVAVRRLRAKIEDDPSAPRYIKTMHGVGYAWAVIE
jgi:DNA-binding response OmpR family regulator